MPAERGHGSCDRPHAQGLGRVRRRAGVFRRRQGVRPEKGDRGIENVAVARDGARSIPETTLAHGRDRPGADPARAHAASHHDPPDGRRRARRSSSNPSASVLREDYLESIPSGVSWQGLSEIYRETLVVARAEVMRFALRLPANPWLDLNIGTVEDGPVTFRVSAVLRRVVPVRRAHVHAASRAHRHARPSLGARRASTFRRSPDGRSR